MTDFFVFNGDADGICSLQQLLLAESPTDFELISGVKRDIALLSRVEAKRGDRVTVLDISLDKNRQPLQRLLADDVSVRYFDHHYAGDVPDSPSLETHIDTDASRGTSYLVDRYLAGHSRAWAVVGTFGDNFDATAKQLAEPLDLSSTELERLRELGILLNYNGYGSSIDDLHLPPVELFRRIRPFADPLRFAAEEVTFNRLREGYRADMEAAAALEPQLEKPGHALYLLPNERWSRRVSGVFANRLAQAAPERAHAILTELEQGGYLVSVRAPIANPDGADELCRRFPTGGGRKAAAGINHLAESDYQPFVDAFAETYR
ncbi:MAG: acetyltransferase [Gammaproteobacteria bacterium]|nr:acetyltransferase [Gammaproteobacteria bacterium]